MGNYFTNFSSIMPVNYQFYFHPLINYSLLLSDIVYSKVVVTCQLLNLAYCTVLHFSTASFQCSSAFIPKALDREM
jgi:hypothetical protein